MEILIEAKALKKYFEVKKGFTKSYLKAVDDFNLAIYKGETFGLVGESGCGKSTAGRTLMRLYDPTAGNIIFDNKDITKLTAKELKPFRRKMQIIFQDPYASLNPYMTVFEIVAEPLEAYFNLSAEEKKARVSSVLKRVGLSEEHMNRYPHEFSGGQRQRIGIARAIVSEPEFILCDEPISALDVSIQAQIVNMLEDIQKEMGITLLFIAHDLAMVKHISDRIGVMYMGKLVEIAESKALYQDPKHPYTKALLSAIPVPNPRLARNREKIILSGDVISPIDPPANCLFHSRCPYATDLCRAQIPELKEVTKGHFVACHFDL